MGTDALEMLLLLVGVGVLSTVYIVVWRHAASARAKSCGLPPGREGLPLVGETLRLIAAYKTENPEPFIDERVRRHGRLFTTHVFGERTVFSADPEFNRLVLGAEGRAFECSYPASISTLLGAHSLLLLRGLRHRRMHALTVSRFASPTALRSSLLPDVDRLVRHTLDAWPDGATVRLLDQAKKISFDLTVRQLMGLDPGDWTEGLRRHYLRVIDGFFSVPITLPSYLSSFTTYGRALQARTKVAEALREVVRRRREENERKKRDGCAAEEEEEDEEKEEESKVVKPPRRLGGIKRGRDMLEDLLEAEGGLSEEEAVDFMLALLVAGYETTSTIMTLAVKFLTESPSALATLKKEHEEIKAKKEHEQEPLEWSDYKSMPFTQCVINETLRVANIISGVFRRTTTDIHYKGYTIPEGCKVFASFRAVHLDPKQYDDARSFNPWRWQDKDIPSQPTGGSRDIFTPFGGGPRLCPGYELARVEISIFLHYLLTRFSWEVAEEDRLVFFPTTRTQKGYPIKVHRGVQQ